jgi:hypothetical protein
VVGDQTPADVAVPVGVVLAVQLAVTTLRVQVAPEAALRVMAPVLAIPGTPAAGMIAAATGPLMRGSPETTAPGRDVTTAPGREPKIAPRRVVMTGPVRVVMRGPVRVAMTDPARVVMTGPARAATIGQVPVVMTEQLHVGTTATYRVGEGVRAGRTARRQKAGGPRYGMTGATAVPRVARARRTVAPATSEALPSVDRVATTGARRPSVLLVGMTEVPVTVDRDVMIGRRRVARSGLGRDVMIGPGLAGTTAQGHAGSTGVGRDVMTGPDRRVRPGVGGGRIAAHVVAIALRGRFGSAVPGVTRTRPARAVTIRRSPQVSPAPSSTVRSKPNCARCRGASLTWSRSTWSPRVG